jgi:hypothetical protein
MKARALACGVLIVLLAGACSDDGDTRPRVDKDEMVRKADDVCKTANADLATLFAKPGGASNADTKAALDLLNTEVFPRLDRELGDLKELGEPKNDRVIWDEMIRQYDLALSTLKNEASADPAQAIKDVPGAYAAGRAKARDFGSKECGSA